MSKDLYKGRKMYQNPTVLIITGICVIILSIFLIDIVSKHISVMKIDDDTKSVLKSIMEYDKEDINEYAISLFKKKGYTNPNINIVNVDDGILLTNNSSYFTLIGELFRKPKYHNSCFIGNFNEYHEIVIKEYDEDKMSESDLKNDDEIIIK